MVLTMSDLIAITIALVSMNTLLIVAFRRVLVLERRLSRYER